MNYLKGNVVGNGYDAGGLKARSVKTFPSTLYKWVVLGCSIMLSFSSLTWNFSLGSYSIQPSDFSFSRSFILRRVVICIKMFVKHFKKFFLFFRVGFFGNILPFFSKLTHCLSGSYNNAFSALFNRLAFIKVKILCIHNPNIMKYLIFLLLPFTVFSQTHTLSDGSKLVVADDLLKGAIIVNTENPIEVQFAPGVHYKVVIIERKDASTTELIRIGKTGVTVTPKQSIDDTEFFYSVKNPTVNTANATMWNTFKVASGVTWPDAFHNDTGTFSNALNTFAEISFTGKRAVLWAEVSNNKGIAGISVDRKPEVEKDMYAPTGTNNTQAVFDTGTLPQGNHKIKIRVTGKANSASQDKYLLLDKVDVYE